MGCRNINSDVCGCLNMQQRHIRWLPLGILLSKQRLRIRSHYASGGSCSRPTQPKHSVVFPRSQNKSNLEQKFYVALHSCRVALPLRTSKFPSKREAPCVIKRVLMQPSKYKIQNSTKMLNNPSAASSPLLFTLPSSLPVVPCFHSTLTRRTSGHNLRTFRTIKYFSSSYNKRNASHQTPIFYSDFPSPSSSSSFLFTSLNHQTSNSSLAKWHYCPFRYSDCLVV